MYQTIGPMNSASAFQVTPIFAKHPTYDYAVNFDDWASQLNVALPFNQLIQFSVVQFPRDTWVGLNDNADQPIPLVIYVDHRGAVIGRWLGE
jgi:hypothetical protein